MRIERPDPLVHAMPGPPLAIAAEALFLINLMLLPVLGFLLLCGLWHRHRRHHDPLVRSHLRQTMSASLWGGAFLAASSLGIFAIGGLDNPWSWVIGVLYFLLVHALLILLGFLGLVRAMNGHDWRYPVIGPYSP